MRSRCWACRSRCARVGHDELQRQDLQHRHLGADQRGHPQVGCIADKRSRAGLRPGGGDRGRGEPPDQLAGQPLQRDRRGERGVVLADGGDHRQLRQPLRRPTPGRRRTGRRPSRSTRRAGPAQRRRRRRQAPACRCGPTPLRPRRRAPSRRHRRPSPSPGPPGTAGTAAPAPASSRRRRCRRRRSRTCCRRGRALPRVLRDGVQRRAGQVQPGATVLRIKDFGLESGQDPEVLRIALEPAVRVGHFVSARSPLCPYGGWPMSCASPAMSTRSGSQPSPIAMPRPI